ncbi:MAG TPA: DNA polymerase III subunit delta' [Bdellovibrionota bacterium]|nr:DNA polymerase III subunit delta' [Bdellovibrionota bacterium]
MALKNILGHSKQIGLVRQAIQHGRVPHAYLFSGVKGSGKGLLAENLAKLLNCQNPVDPGNALDCCDECVSCKKVLNRSHPDVYFIKPDGQFIKTEQLREVLKAVAFKPYEGRWKIFIIDQAETLHPHGANVLLKTLEEPTPRTFFILVTSNSNLILPTILSRCQRVRFGGIPRTLLENALQEKTKLSPSEISFYADMAEGSLGKGLSLIEGELRGVAENQVPNLQRFLMETKVEEPEGLEKFFELSQGLANEKEKIPLLLDLLKSWYRDLVLWKMTKDESLLTHQKHKNFIIQQGESLSTRDIFRRCDLVDQLSLDISQNANIQLAIEKMALSCLD